jgi:hypothetical protein
MLLLKAMKPLGKPVRPLARLLLQWFPGTVFSLFLVLMPCFLVVIVLWTVKLVLPLFRSHWAARQAGRWVARHSRDRGRNRKPSTERR